MEEDQDEIIATVNGDNSTSSSSQSVKSVISLLSFNLEPLTDTLEHLELSDNGFQVLPMQFQGRSFARLHHLDFSHNPIKGTYHNAQWLKIIQNVSFYTSASIDNVSLI